MRFELYLVVMLFLFGFMTYHLNQSRREWAFKAYEMGYEDGKKGNQKKSNPEIHNYCMQKEKSK